MNELTTQKPIRPSDRVTPKSFTGLLTGLRAGACVSQGALEMVSLLATDPQKGNIHSNLATPATHLELVEVPSYGTVVFRNKSKTDPLIVPMHVGFFQPGAQNHATSRTFILAPGEQAAIKDCFCVQASQGGLLKESQQRFLMLPLGLRSQALALRNKSEYSRLWKDIDGYTRHHGMATGGHLERFLRPNFSRLLPLRHALESEFNQVGAAYFVAGRMAGFEVTPSPAYWQDLASVLTMYCYGPAALLAQRRGYQRVNEPLNLDGLSDLDDLTSRLLEARSREISVRADLIEQLATLVFDQQSDSESQGLSVATLDHKPWAGQVVRRGRDVLYASVFRNVTEELGHQAT